MVNKFLWIFLTFFLSIVSPVFSGSESDVDCNEEDGGDGDVGILGYMGLPLLFPVIDFVKGRCLIQTPPKLAPYRIEDPIIVPIPKTDKGLPIAQADLIDQEQEIAPSIALDEFEISEAPPQLLVDKYNRKTILMDHGSSDNPYLVRDHGILNLGLLAGVSFVDTQTYVLQYNALAKFFYTSGAWSEREASNYEKAKKLKKLKVPTKSKHFDSWNDGDEMRTTGSIAVAMYAGVSAYIADGRVGGIMMGNWAKDIKKLDDNLVRIAFTREAGLGLTARIQPLPLTKMEENAIKDWERTLVFDYDRSTKEGRKELEDALNNKKFLQSVSDEDNVTLLTTRNSGRKKVSRNLQAGFPFIVRARKSWHRVKMSQEITNERNNATTKFASKGYMKQRVYRHLNLPKTNKHKKWKHFTYTNFHYNKISQGSAKVIKNEITNVVKRSDIKLYMEVSFTHDRVKVKKVNDYNKTIAKKVGINDFVIDIGYKNKKQIGYAGLTYKLNVSTDALNDIIAKAAANKHLFDEVSTNLIDNYFEGKKEPLNDINEQPVDDNLLNEDALENSINTDSNYKKDPHSICRGTFTNRRICIGLIKMNTNRKLNKISSDLRKLSKAKNIKSKSASSTLLAKIARRLRSNQFVLQSFISLLPPNDKGYGTFELEGERFLSKKFIVDPNNQREIFDNVYEEEDGKLFDKNDPENERW